MALDIGVVKPLTPDGLCGYDKHGQLWVWEKNGIDMSGHMIGDPRGSKCKLCLQGWILTTESMKDQHWSREYEEWMHRSCMIRFLALKDRDIVYWGLCEARIRFEDFKEIPNGYWPPKDPWAARSWYTAKTIGAALDFKIGMRKHVWNISVAPRDGHAITSVKAFREAFADQNVTKGFNTFECMIHAHNHDDFRKYLKIFGELLGLHRWDEKPVDEKKA